MHSSRHNCTAVAFTCARRPRQADAQSIIVWYRFWPSLAPVSCTLIHCAARKARSARLYGTAILAEVSCLQGCWHRVRHIGRGEYMRSHCCGMTESLARYSSSLISKN